MKDAFFDVVIGQNFFKEIGSNFRQSYFRGQFYWTHVYYNYQDLKFWRPTDYDVTKTFASSFKIVSAGADAFNRKMPLYAPILEIDEEFIVITAKRRPVILLSPVFEIENVTQVRRGVKINRKLCIIAPLFSVEDEEGKAKIDPAFVDRIRTLELPNLFFIPENKGAGIRNSICRLDSLQTAFTNHLNALDICLNDEVLEVFKGQIEFYLTERYDDEQPFGFYRESLLSDSIKD